MKPCRVVVTLELETDASLACLRDREMWATVIGRDASVLPYEVRVEQVKANVLKPKRVK